MNRGIWSLRLAKKRHKCDYGLCGGIISYFGIPSSIADLGCGSGLYCKFFKTIGCKIVTGFEGTVGVKELGIYDDIVTIDLTVPLVDLPYSLVLCLEVGEHIPMEFEQVFLDNVRRFVGSNLVISWARPGQRSASGHVNCRPLEYIKDQLIRRELLYNSKGTDFLKKTSDFSWLRDNLLVFGVPHEK